jgi:hypothetical protein
MHIENRAGGGAIVRARAARERARGGDDGRPTTGFIPLPEA